MTTLASSSRLIWGHLIRRGNVCQGSCHSYLITVQANTLENNDWVQTNNISKTNKTIDFSNLLDCNITRCKEKRSLAIQLQNFLQSKDFNKEKLKLPWKRRIPPSIKTNILNTRNKTHLISRNYSEPKEKQSIYFVQLFGTPTTMTQRFIFGGHFENKITKLRNKCFWHLEYNSKKGSVSLDRLWELSRLEKYALQRHFYYRYGLETCC
jgi:hypothetical protein